VRFQPAVEAAVEDGHRLFVEVSAHPVVTHSIIETIDAMEVDDGVAVGTIRRGAGGVRTVLGNLAELHAHGAMCCTGCSPPGSLDFFVMFSSCGQFARLTGQASYAAANSFLDALAAHRKCGRGHLDGQLRLDGLAGHDPVEVPRGGCAHRPHDRGARAGRCRRRGVRTSRAAGRNLTRNW
jgi:KR domain/Acyl transferase domain